MIWREITVIALNIVTLLNVFIYWLNKTVSQIIHTTSRGHYLIQELHASSLPDLLHYCSQFLIGLLQVPCTDTNSRAQSCKYDEY